MGLAPEDVANRLVNVGSLSRATKLSTLLDSDTEVKKIVSDRGFTTFTGKYQGVDVSIVAIGMGISMMDFFVRETRAVVSGPMATIRYGTCGGVSNSQMSGSVIVMNGSGMAFRDPDAFAHLYAPCPNETVKDTDIEPYRLSKLAPAHPVLTSSLTEEMKGVFQDGSVPILNGINVTAESFYSSQGRIDDKFIDDNSQVIDQAQNFYKCTDSPMSMEMEAFQLLHLAACATPENAIHAAAAAIVVADRMTGSVISGETLHLLELEGGRAVLNALIKFHL
jgi:uridine phosphorylase